VFGVLQSNPVLVGRVKTFKEVNLDFLTIESIVFHLDQPNALEKIYSISPDPSFPAFIGKKLMNVCISLNEHPCIRYQGNSRFAHEVATSLHQGLLQYKRLNAGFWCYGDDRHTERERAQILILDRSFDALSPLIHEFSYQACAYDLLDVNEGVYNYEVETGKGKEERTALLNESDEFWNEHRHSHIAKIVDVIKERLNDIIQNEPEVAKLAKKSSGDMDISQMAAAVKKLPQYQQIMTKLTLHVDIAKALVSKVTASGLINISQLESTISTGVDEAGQEIRGQKLFQMVLEALKSPSAKDIKLRLLAIYYVTQKGLPGTEEFIRQAFSASRLSTDDQKMIENFERLLSAAGGGAVTAEEKRTLFSSIFGSSNKVSRPPATVEGEYIESRHVPLVKIHLEQLLSGQLPMDRFPAMGPSVITAAKSEAKSVRRFGAANKFGKKDNLQFTGGRFMVFIAGGITFAETKVAYELMMKEQKEVVFGSTNITTPDSYLSDVGSLHKPSSGSAAGGPGSKAGREHLL
jgi:syntaxin-binding protein 1